MNLLSRLVAIALLVFPLTAWSLPEAHIQANSTLIEVGGWCSGTIISKKLGLIATAAHCVNNVEVQKTRKHTTHGDGDAFTWWENYYVPFKVTQRKIDDYGNDVGSIDYLVEVIYAGHAPEPTTDADIAILRNISGVAFDSEATMSEAPVKFGDTVYPIGNPMSMHGVVTVGQVAHPSVIVGVLSETVHLIMMTAAIDYGSSGGGVFNDVGQLIGIASAKNPDGYEGFVVPISYVFEALKNMGLRNTQSTASN